MSDKTLFYSLVILLVFWVSACNSGEADPSPDDQIEAKIDRMFDFSNLDAPPPPYEGPTTCLYRIKTDESLIRKAKNREELFDNGLKPCTWAEDALEVKYTPTGRFFFSRKGSLGDVLFPSDWSCPKPSAPLFDDLIATQPDEVPIFDLPVGCFGARQQRSHEHSFSHPGKLQAGKLVCLRVEEFGSSKEVVSEGATPAQEAAWVIQSWQSEFGFPVRYVVVSGDQVDVLLNRQYPALGATWEDVLYQWMTDLNFKPSPVECPDVHRP